VGRKHLAVKLILSSLFQRLMIKVGHDVAKCNEIETFVVGRKIGFFGHCQDDRNNL